MVFLTEQTNQKFQISHEGIVCWLVSKKDQYKQKNKTHFSFLMNEVFGIADRRMEENMSDLQVGPDNISTAFEDG